MLRQAGDDKEQTGRVVGHLRLVSLCSSKNRLCRRAEYAQEGIDAAVRDFAVLAGDANAELLAAFVAKALQQASEDAAYVRSGARSFPFACYADHPKWPCHPDHVRS